METEKAIISCLLTKPELIEETELNPEMFTNEYLGMIYFEMKEQHDRGQQADVVTLSDGLAEKIPPEILGSVLMECMSGESFTGNFGQYTRILQKEYAARQLNGFINHNKIDGKNIDNVVSMLSGLIDGMGGKRGNCETASDLVKRYSKDLFNENRRQGIPLGYPNIDNILQNLDEGDMCIVAARPSVGKSAITTEIALNIAKKGYRVGMFNLEMTNEQVYQRLIAHESGIELRRIRRAINFLGDEKMKFDRGNKIIDSLGDNLILIDDCQKVSEISKAIKTHKMDIAIIDYAQLIESESNYRGNRYAEVGAISHSVKRAAKKYKIPIILLAQLNRKSEQTETKEPTMGELREAGDFEQDASQIILLWNKDEEKRTKGVKIDKNRQGEVGKTELIFDGKTMHFSQVEEETPFY